MLGELIVIGFTLGVIWYMGRELGIWKWLNRWIQNNKGRFEP